MILESKILKKIPSYGILKVKLTEIYLCTFLKDVVAYRFVQLSADDFGINLRSTDVLVVHKLRNVLNSHSII